jgi:Holliday junction resolvase RusA-like endonuclease
MMEIRHYIIPGDPVPLARPRVGRYHVWDSQKTTKLAAGLHLRNQHEEQPYFTGPLELKIMFYLPIPKVRWKNPPHHHIFKPDLDNLVKFVCDICNEILYHDDCIVSRIEAQKVYDRNPRTEFTIVPIK